MVGLRFRLGLPNALLLKRSIIKSQCYASRDWIASPVVRGASAEVWNSMATVISLREVIEAMEMQGENCLSFLHPDTGEIVTTTEEERRLAEEPDESLEQLPEWQRQMVRRVRAVLTGKRWLQLPNRFEIHEWSTMNEFAQAQHSERGKARTAGGDSWSGRLSDVPQYDSAPRLRKQLVSLPRGGAG